MSIHIDAEFYPFAGNWPCLSSFFADRSSLLTCLALRLAVISVLVRAVSPGLSTITFKS